MGALRLVTALLTRCEITDPAGHPVIVMAETISQIDAKG